MNRRLLIPLIFAFQSLFASEDTTRVFRLNDVVVTGTRSAVAVEQLPSSVFVADSGDIDRINGISVADIIRSVSGLSLRSYGGNGALQSLSVRGMGSDYSLILVDGQRYTMHQISTVDLGIMTVNEIERIEIANGGNSSIYGTNAIGGVVNLITKKPKNGFSAAAGISAGSFGTSGYRISLGTGSDAFAIRGAFQSLSGRNNFDFNFDDGTGRRRLYRLGADYNVKNIALSAGSIIGDKTVSNITVRYTDADRGQPAAVTNSVQDNRARIHDEDLFFNSVTVYAPASSFTLTIPVSYHYNRQTYFDPKLIINNEPLAAHYENTAAVFSPYVSLSFSSDHSADAGSEISVATITSNEVRSARRELRSVFASSRHTFFLPVEVVLFPSIRYDHFSDTEGDVSPKIGLNIGILNEPLFRVRASAGKNYRVPTFNDLYWIDGGNPNLKPERSVNYDAGVVTGFRSELFDISITAGYFAIDARDKIVWQPAHNGLWSPKNLQSVSSKGWELSAGVNAFENVLMLFYHHTVAQTIKVSADIPNDNTQNKILPFVPQESASISVGSAFSGFSVNLLYSFTGYRFETAENNPRYVLPSYETVDMNISQTILLPVISFRVRAEINNLTNVDYQHISGYPLPLRNYRISTEISL
ncbi:MAG: TonB-dependent receptor plug domain-containing protein [Bacteroidota bacterium]